MSATTAFVETPSGIALPVQERSEREIETQLKFLDRDLFLTKEVHRPTGVQSYAVYHYIGPDRPPVHVLYWTSNRKRDGEPLPLSTGIFYEVESRKQFFGRNIVQESEAANEARRERDLAAADAEREQELLPYFKRRLKFGPSVGDRLHADDPFERIRKREGRSA